MKIFNKNKAQRHIKIKLNRNTYIKRLSIALSCLFLFVCVILLTFAKFNSSSDVYELINGKINYLNACEYNSGQTWDYNYTGSSQEFNAPCYGKYKIELWGASGYETNSATAAGKGGYVSGEISLNTTESLFVYVGSNQKYDNNYTYNGGGLGEAIAGGATDVRLTSGEWNNFDSLKSRIMVAAGGGGGFYASNTTNHVPGHAGGLRGYDADCTYNNQSMSSTGRSGHGATQTAYGTTNVVTTTNSHQSYINDGYHSVNAGFGFGGYGAINSNSHYSSGGGSGYYGGSHGIHPGSSWTGGGGGSSFISGYSGCNAILESSTSSNITHTNQPNHYSGKIFTNSVMIDGKGCNWSTGSAANCGNNQVQPNGTNAAGHTGNGYARVTLLTPYKKIKIKLNTNGGILPKYYIYPYIGDKFVNLPVPLKDDYIFDGWYSDSSLTNEVNSNTVVTESINNLYAKYIPVNVNITFNPNGGSVSPTTKTVMYNSTYGDLPTPTKSGSSFKGWRGSNLININWPESTPSSTSINLGTKRTFTPNTLVIGLAFDNYYGQYQNIKNSLSISNNQFQFTASNGYGVAFPILSSANKTYSISYDASVTSGGRNINSIMFYKSDGSLISNIRECDGSGNRRCTFTTPANTYYLVIEFCTNGTNQTVTIKNLMLHEGNNVLNYEPYYITSSSTVVNYNPHTLTAIW